MMPGAEKRARAAMWARLRELRAKNGEQNSHNFLTSEIDQIDHQIDEQPSTSFLWPMPYRQRDSSDVATSDDGEGVVEEERRRPPPRQRQLTARTIMIEFQAHMDRNFYNDTLDSYCRVCDRIWWGSMLRPLRPQHVEYEYVRHIGYDPTIEGFVVCRTCRGDLVKGKTPHLATINGFVYPPEANLPELCPISERLVSPRLPFMCIRQVRFFAGSRKLRGQVINVPIDVDTMVHVLPRSIDDDHAFNVRIKRHLLNKSSYLAGCVSKRVVKDWLRYLVTTPLYRQHNITVSPEYLRDDDEDGGEERGAITCTRKVIAQIYKNCLVEDDGAQWRCAADADIDRGAMTMSTIQETIFWGEDFILEMAPGQNERPMSLAFDGDAEELSFPNIYYGQPREFKVHATPYQMATSEIRRRDRRGVRSNHVLYMAAKIMRLSMINSFNVMFRSRRGGPEPTRDQLNDTEYLREKLLRNEAFMESLPNSIQYWRRRKIDLFAMMRQLGKPTVFLTLSASEIHWLPLLRTVYRYQHDIPSDEPINDVIFADMLDSHKAMLINDDPVMCCLYFDRLVNCILKSLKLKKGPFGKYRVLEYFRRIEFQHRGSPHCHLLLWLDNAPPTREVKFEEGEHLPETISLIDDICSVESAKISSTRKLQTHRHTHTCYKRSTGVCRFGIPYWPMKRTLVLLPKSGDERNESLVTRYCSLRDRICAAVNGSYNTDGHGYDSIDAFWEDNEIVDEADYLEILRHGIHRPNVMYKREFEDIMTSSFNPIVSKVLESNMDVQYILDEYSCASYVAEYVNKSERGLSNLHRELIKLREECPEMDYDDCLKEIGKRSLNNVEMCAQEAAWYLLRLPMSEASRGVAFIPTCHPTERYRCKKTNRQMDAERLAGDSTDVWLKNVVEWYETRPDDLRDLSLADFVAWYDRVRSRRNATDDAVVDDADNDNDGCDVRVEEEVPGEEDDVGPVRYRRRSKCKILRWTGYKVSDLMNYQRELVTLFWPFRSEELDLLNNDAYLEIFRENEQLLLQRLSAYQSELCIDEIIERVNDQRDLQEIEQIANEEENADRVGAINLRDEAAMGMNRDIDMLIMRDTVVRTVRNEISHDDFCGIMRSLNRGQLGLVLEFMTRLVYGGEPMQIFFSGPAGSGKTYVLRAMMETANRFTDRRNKGRCAYLACATTGKAAVNIDGTTVHSGLNIGIDARRNREISLDRLQTMRCDFSEIRTIFIDEVSMMGQDMLCRVSDRLRACGPRPQDRFGGFHVIFSGDLRQLPPVKANEIYTRPSNMLQDRMLWQNLQFYNLKEVMRQTDKQFSDVLTKIGDGCRLSQAECELIESRFIDIEELHRRQRCGDESIRKAIRLFHTNAQVNDYNYRRLREEEEEQEAGGRSGRDFVRVLAVDTMLGAVSEQQKQSIRHEIKKLQQSNTGYLPHKLHLAVGSPYIMTHNVDKNDRLVNGSTGVLKLIERSTEIIGVTCYHPGRQSDNPTPDDEGDNATERVVRVWLLFDDEHAGTKVRLKYSQHMREHMIDASWTPVVMREVPIQLGKKFKNIKTRRKQFPLLPCHAITIHKSQGASFDSVVYEYDRTHCISLVYVALSRARTISGLHLTNSKHDHKFYHCRKDEEGRHKFREEMRRLSSKRLITVVDRNEKFVEEGIIVGDSAAIAVFNTQSLNAHKVDISNDHVLRKVSLMAMSETWMPGGSDGGIDCEDYRHDCSPSICKFLNLPAVQSDDVEMPQASSSSIHTTSSSPPAEINGFQCVARARNDSLARRGGGGVAIYESIKSHFSACHKVKINRVDSRKGDVCCAYVRYKDKMGVDRQFCLVAFYCRPNITADQLMCLADEALWRFSRVSMPFHISRRGDLYWCPIIICGDFNFNFSSDQGPTVINYLRELHSLEYVSGGIGPSNRSGSTIDAVFTKRVDVELMYQTLYFSTHRSLLVSAKGDGTESNDDDDVHLTDSGGF